MAKEKDVKGILFGFIPSNELAKMIMRYHIRPSREYRSFIKMTNAHMNVDEPKRTRKQILEDLKAGISDKIAGAMVSLIRATKGRDVKKKYFIRNKLTKEFWDLMFLYFGLQEKGRDVICNLIATDLKNYVAKNKDNVSFFGELKLSDTVSSLYIIINKANAYWLPKL